jgi:hypothetical protein
VFAVTGLPASLQDDQGERMRRYLVSMGIRTICFILAVVALAWLHWTLIGWTLVIAAVVLPYVAVVMANATRSRRSITLGPATTSDPAPPLLTPDRPDEDPPT